MKLSLLTKQIGQGRILAICTFLLTLFFTSVGINSSFAQRCCLTSDLTINTGYNPSTNTQIAPTGTGLLPANTDPKWVVQFFTPCVAAAAGYGWPPPSGSSPLTTVLVPGQSDVVQAPAGSAGGPLCNAISCMNAPFYHTVTPGGVLLCGTAGTATDYYMDFTREIFLCKPTQLDFSNVCISADNGVDVFVSNTGYCGGGCTAPVFSLNPGVGFTNANWVNFNCMIDPATGAGIVLPTAGTYSGTVTITIRVYQFNHVCCVDPNNTYLTVSGTVHSTVADAIYLESTGCSPSWPYCKEPAITGTNTVCVDASNNLSDTFTGGTWTSSNTAVATIGAFGTYTGVSAGTATMSYTDLCGRTVTFPVTVNPLPTITGPDAVCPNSTITLTGSPSGGTWTSDDYLVASVGATSGVVTGNITGSVTIYYTDPLGCVNTHAVSVYPAPTLSGTASVCVGSTTFLVGSLPGGTYTITGTTIATVVPSGSYTGIITGVSAGTTTLTYTVPPIGCFSTVVITVNPTPTITGDSVICVGSTLTLAGTPPGGTWTSLNTAIATVGISTGVVTGHSGGTVIIKYTAGDGCIAEKTITVNPVPGITGSSSICAGTTTTLTGSPSSGTWTSSNLSVATIGSTSGILTSVGPGTTTVTYTLSDGCMKTLSFTVNPLPSVITGNRQVCIGQTTILSDSLNGGTWASGDTSIATVLTVLPALGYVTGISAGTVIIAYTLPTGCQRTTIFTVNPLPSVITGPDSGCAHFTITLSDTTAGGLWTSGSTSIATVGSTTGIVDGISLGDAIITYKLTATGCYQTKDIRVNAVPGPIAGPDSICAGASAAYTDPVTGGGVSWTSSNSFIATVGATTGVVTGANAGVDTIIYTNVCGSAEKTITVNPLPVFTVTATPTSSSVCEGTSTDTLYASAHDPRGGIVTYLWTPCDCFCTTCDPATTFVSFLGVGTYTYTATARTGLGCSSNSSTTITVRAAPDRIIGLTAWVCVGSTTTYTDDSTGGTWTSSNPSIATIDPTSGLVTGISAGADTIYYTIIGTGCSVFLPITVNPLPAPITGNPFVCIGATIPLSDTSSGGTWSGGPVGIILVSGSGVVTGAGVGAGIVTYTLDATGCAVTDTITVNPLPASITGNSSLCVGSRDTLHDSSPGGTWTSSNTSVATINPGTGIVMGITAGTDTITYTIGTGCFISEVITIDPLPAPITGRDTVCVHSTVALSDSVSGGTWTSLNIGIETVGSGTGIVTGVSIGQSRIVYTLGTGCSTSVKVRVDSLPAIPSITGVDTICVGMSTTLSDGTSGGVWSTTSTFITLTTKGVVTGISQGTATVFYTVTDDCGSASVEDYVTVQIPSPPITGGYSAVCSGGNDTLYNAAPGGVWTSSDTTIAVVSSTGIVTGISTGEAYITYTAANSCGPFTVTRLVIVNQATFITTNFLVACQTLGGGGGDGGGGGGGTIIPGSCIIICDSTVVRYYANGNDGIFTWVVTGGTVANNYGDSIDVIWPTPGVPGTITLYDTSTTCTGMGSLCVKVIQKPHANFTSSATHICLDDHIAFTDHSTADTSSALVSWVWDFGDGFGGSIPNPTHTYTAPGIFTVTLVVRNACNCTDTFRETIFVAERTGPRIVCPSIVCDSEFSTYSTTAVCPNYHWSVTGGVITSGIGTASITVLWNAAAPGGFGTVSLAVDCADICSDTTTITVPVILQNADISGPSVVCQGKQYEFSLPLWAATQYKWGILGHPEFVVGYDNDYKIVADFLLPGTYTVHGWYQNRIKLCGGNVFKTITVQPAVNIIGNTTICQYGTGSFILSDPSLSPTWTLTDGTGTVLYVSSALSFAYPFAASGSYTLSASGPFCVDAITISVLPLLGPIDSVNGPDTVCLNRVYTYVAYSASSGIFNWQITGGSLSPASGSDSVTVIWTDPGIKTLSVNLINAACTGPVTTVNVIQDPIDPTITGNATPCADGQQIYTCAYPRGEDYNWTIMPNTAGSVISGNYTSAPTILWNNYSGPASIAVKITKCDSTVFDTLNVTVIPLPTIALAASPNPGCPDTWITFTATPGDASYRFTWDDGTASTIGSASTVNHFFPLNTTTSNITYHVTVSATPGGGGCPPIGAASVTETILPGPVAFASTADNVNLCPGSSALLVATVTNNVSGLTYQWQGSGVPPGATDTTYTANWESFPDDFSFGVWFIVTASNGCTSQSNHIIFQNLDSCGTPGTGTHHDSGISEGGGAICPIPLTATFSCNTLTLFAPTMLGDIGTWTAETIPPSGPLPLFTSAVTCTYDEPGIYRFDYAGSYTGCHVDTVVADTLGIIPDFRWKLHCGTGGMDSLFLQDYSAYLPWWHMDSIAWDLGGIRMGGGANLTLFLAAPGSYTFTEKVYGTMPDGPFVCTSVHTINVPHAPNAAFTDSLSPTCSNIPMSFTPADSLGIVSYFWDFGDGASLIAADAKRTYVWSLPMSNPQIWPVHHYLTDSIGCADTFSLNVSIHNNNISGSLGSETVCANSRPAILMYAPDPLSSLPILYQWSNGITNTTGLDSIYKSGTYWVTLTDPFQCRSTLPTPAAKVKIIYTPQPQIQGPKVFCSNQEIQLGAFAGYGVSYQWFRNGVFTNTGPYFYDGSELPGSITVQVVIGVLDTPSGLICYDSSALDTLVTLPAPATPAITGPVVVDCNDYHLQLTAFVPETGRYNWSNGIAGPTDDIYSGGPYLVQFTSLNGCTSFAEVTVPPLPDVYLQYFPTGCYSLCAQQLPITLYGPPNVPFDYWAWLVNGDTASNGAGLMMPYSIDSGGNYNWYFNNGLCGRNSDTMDVTTMKCDGCDQTSLSAVVTCTPSDPASYSITVGFANPGGGTSYVLGTNIGPIDPFSGTIPSGGYYFFTLTFTTLELPPPDSVTVQLIMTLPAGGAECFSEVTVPLPACLPWVSERPGTSDTTIHGNNPPSNKLTVASALLVFPNPASGDVTISYDYGADIYTERSLSVYDAMGRKIQYIMPQDWHGNWTLNTDNWTPGVYIIRMEADGKMLQTQRVVVVSR